MLARLLLEKGYVVHGVVRRASTHNTARLEDILRDPNEQGVRLLLHYGDLTDGTGLRRILDQVKPDEVYNLGAQSHVKVSYEQPEYTADTVATGTLRLLEAVSDCRETSGKEIRFFQAGSSEMFGSAQPPQNEDTPFQPQSPYGISKAAAHWFTVHYRETNGLFASNGIMFNHESPCRGETFLTRKVSLAVARIAHGLQDKLYLGNLDARRDWGYAGDFVEAMWLMLQQPAPCDLVIASGETRSVREFVEEAFGHAGIDWRKHVEQDARYLQQAEGSTPCGDIRRAKEILGWEPRTSFSQLVRMMVDADMKLARREKVLQNGLLPEEA